MSDDSRHNNDLIRLGCISCDRVDCDGVREIPDGWEDVDECSQQYDGWETHLSICPECLDADSTDGQE